MANGLTIKRRKGNTQFVDYGDTVEASHYVEEGKYLVFDESFFEKVGQNLIYSHAHKTRISLYEKEELVDLLRRAGFKVLGTLRTLSFEELNEIRDDRVTFIGIKE
ncbi:hypothetical protein HS7_13450 [Sulfolobales archaeon HS-7]|nr:hypothetical protein HS7_13450 [Sulfolobales archaeon HS-7]